jgi:hypothetical protein
MSGCGLWREVGWGGGEGLCLLTYSRPLFRFYTPYFQTFAFDALFQAGEADYCVEQYQVAWGWALEQSSTWLEVFDARWEVVHSWSSCPTWQLSRFFLGLAPR